jgi:hypothetical protein
MDTILKVIDDTREYIWCGSFGCWFKSFEVGVKAGDTRFIANKLFYAYTVRNRNYNRFYFGGPREVNWCPVDNYNHDMEAVRNFKRKTFGL